MARQESQTSYAAMRAKILLGCYRTGEANDPDTYVAAIAAILSRYPQEVITAVTHPATGLPSKKGWLPTVKEVVDACDAANEPIVQNELRLRRIKEQLEQREREDRGERPTAEQMEARYGKNFGIGEVVNEARKARFQAPSVEQLREHYQSKPGYLQWLADRKRVMRGEIEDYPKPEGAS
jgi:hypothetical protein